MKIASGTACGAPSTDLAACHASPSRVLLNFRWLLRQAVAPLVEHHLAAPYGMRLMTYDLRCLARKGLLERLADTNRYRLTDLGRPHVAFCVQLYNRVFCRGLAQLQPDHHATSLNQAWRDFAAQLTALHSEVRLAT